VAASSDSAIAAQQFDASTAASTAAPVAAIRQSDDQSRNARSDQDQSSAVAAPAGVDASALVAPTTAPTAPVAATPTTVAAPAPAPLQDQLSRPIFTLRTAPEGTHVLTIRVAPEAIGPVTVRAHISQGNIDVQLIAPSDESTSALNAILPDLKRDLAQGGMNAALTLHQHTGTDLGSSWTPSSGQDSRGGSGGGAADFGSRGTPSQPQAQSPRGAASVAPTTPARAMSSDSSLDVLA
jgi:flagellar hook-length control protein FliK